MAKAPEETHFHKEEIENRKIIIFASLKYLFYKAWERVSLGKHKINIHEYKEEHVKAKKSLIRFVPNDLFGCFRTADAGAFQRASKTS